MRVGDVMGRPVRLAEAKDSIADAAAAMADRDVGALPVVEGGQLIGIVTDRDILVRGVAQGVPRTASVRGVMTPKVVRCMAEDEIDEVLGIMADQQIRRMPVCSADGEVIGIFSIGDAARTEEYQEQAAAALANICRPHGRHWQKRETAGRRQGLALWELA